ncbi:MAG: methionyl-tRNA formyltransferase [Acidimicrobiia bacterium]|nr:methionyl-tRNA formyltransferase [Acidimicrobiia bacterium]
MTGAVFLGTPEAALPTLGALASISDIRLVITQPDKPRGRSRRPLAPPVKEKAIDMGIPVAQPSGRNALTATIRAMAPVDAAVVVAYGQIISPAALEVPRVGWLNVHFSLLPRWRGAAPVAHALLAGDEKTGVSLMHLEEGLDTGPVFASEEVTISPEDDRGTLTATLAELGAGLLVANWAGTLDGSLQPRPQDDEQATTAPKLTPEDRIIDTNESADRIVARVRALAPSPGAQLDFSSGLHKILSAVVSEHPGPESGQLVEADSRLLLGTGDGSVEVLEVQPPGKRVMGAADFLRGRPRLSR